MAENSEISWTDHTFNPWMGCTKVSEACKFCYAERDMDHRYGKVQWGPSGTRVLTTNANWRKPLKWNRDAEQTLRAYEWAARSCQSEYEIPDPPERPRVFCASLADVFEDWQGPIVNAKRERLFLCPLCDHIGPRDDCDEFYEQGDGYLGCPRCAEKLIEETVGLTLHGVRQRFFRLIEQTPHLDWLLLTKRPENIQRFWVDSRFVSDGPHENVWIGTSVENQQRAEERIPHLLNCRGLARVLFLSCEPLLGPLSLGNIATPDGDAFNCLDGLGGPNVDWVISGGESGPSARPSNPDWFRSLRDQCQSAGVAFHHKQNGEWESAGTRGSHCFNPGASIHDLVTVERVGKKKAGRALDGRIWDEFPA